MSKINDIQDGAIQYRAAVVEDLDREKSELLLKCVPYEHEVDLGGNLFESFARGAFAKAAKVPSRLGVWSEHGGPFVGRGIEAEDRQDGFWLRARLGRTQAAQDMAMLIEDKLLTDASVEFVPQAGFMDVHRDGDRIHVKHRRAHLRGVAVTFAGAYGAEAFVASVRAEDKREAEVERARLWFMEWRKGAS